MSTTIGPNARVSDSASVFGSAMVSDSAWVSDSARVYGTAMVYGTARVYGEGDIATQEHIAWVDRVGSGSSMTLHRIRVETGFGWRINAGCCHFEADTLQDVCALVRANVQAGPAEWDTKPTETQARWAAQVFAALDYLTAMVAEEVAS